MRTITLELLRHGPPHNQLLSPLTPYLALCENHAAVTVKLPFEHNQFLHRLRALGYQLGPEARAFQLKDTAGVLGELLAAIPGLTAELSRQCQESGSHTHLRFIVSASELALLPFELAFAQNGFPGAGQQLLLQNALPLSFTRETRRVQEEQLHWPKRPKILLAAAAPPGVGPIPLESHLLALRQAIDPWVKHYDETDDAARRRRIEEHLTLLPSASIRDIEAACMSGEYTHLHLLAHGIEWTDGYDVRYGLALHDPVNPDGALDRVSAARLAGAVRPIRERDPRALHCPAVVTLASCNSGNVGSVAGAGASVAHALHEAGVPLVVGSQFPLSFPGSLRMVETLYNGLLWGQDPRLLVSELRRQLHVGFPEAHDWASIVAYASLPSDFESDLEDVCLSRVMAHINTSMNHADAATKRVAQYRKWTPQAGTRSRDPEHLLEPVRARMERARERLASLLSGKPAKRALILGLLASTEKRQAVVLYAAAGSSGLAPETRDGDRLKARKLLESARDHYWRAFQLDRGGSWAAVQYLSLELVSRRWKSDLETNTSQATKVQVIDESADRSPSALWTLARTLSLQDLNGPNQEKVEWALGNLIELYLLALFPELQGKQVVTPEEAEEESLRYARDLVAKAGSDSFEVYSTRRQILRYVDWYAEEADLGDVLVLARKICTLLPDTANEDWK